MSFGRWKVLLRQTLFPMNIASFIPYIRFSKLANITLVYIGYWLSVVFKRVFIWGYPYAVSIETSAICNLRCPECPTGKNTMEREQGLLSYPDFTQLINKVEEYAVYLNLSLQGEPFLNPDLFKMIRYATDHNIYTSLSTNGHFLDSLTAVEIIQSGLKKIIISVDGTDQETYEIYRKGGSLKKVLDGIGYLSNAKTEKQTKYPEIIIQFIVFMQNEHQIKEIQQLGIQLGATKVELKSAQLNGNDIGLLTTIEKFGRYSKENKTLTIKSKLRNRCFRLWETLVITWDSTVVPCCFDKSVQYKIGNLKNNNLSSVWKSLAFNQFRKKILTERKKVIICCNCTEGLRIKY